MVQVGFGEEIEKIIDALPYEKLFCSEDVANQVSRQLSVVHDHARTATNVKLKRMADKGEIKRIGKGVYCRVKQTVFGPVAPDIDELIAERMMVENGIRIGYESGAGLLNHIGLSTLLPRETEISTNRYRSKLPKGCHIKLVKPPALITEKNWRYFQFINAVERLSTAYIDVENANQIMTKYAKKCELDLLTLIFTARKHCSDKTVFRLIDLFKEETDEPISRQGRI